jgi:hypothetical protein
MCNPCSTCFYSLTYILVHVKYSAIVWMRKLCRESQENVKYIFNFSIILCNTLPPFQYWNQQKALTQISCVLGIVGKAACVYSQPPQVAMQVLTSSVSLRRGFWEIEILRMICLWPSVSSPLWLFPLANHFKYLKLFFLNAFRKPSWSFDLCLVSSFHF